MTRVNLSDSLAADMDKHLNSEESKQMFSSSSVLEKLAFTRVADEGKVPSEVEDELAKQGLLKVAASSCKCEDKHGHEKKCDCPSDCSCHKSEKKSSQIVESILKVSEDLESAGFEKLAALSIVLAEKLVAEAKEKSKSKSSKEEKSKKSDKSKKKMTMKERMEKMRKMQKGKKKGKSSKKSSLEVGLAKRGQVPQHDLIPTSLKPDPTAPAKGNAAELISREFKKHFPNERGQIDVNPVNHVVTVTPGVLVNKVTQVVQQLQQSGQLPGQNRYRIVSSA